MNGGSSLPSTMRASVLRAAGDVVVEERPLPAFGANDVLVRVTSVGVCGSDVHYYEHGRIGDYVVRAPMVLGHEAGGRIAAVGQDVTSVRVGDRVSIEPGWPCGECSMCRSGSYNLCPKVQFFATPPYDGAFCEYVAVPAAFVFKVPDHVSDDAAGLLEPLSVGIWACERAGVRPGSSVLVTGAGPIGLIAGQAALAFGASEVVITDVTERRLELARELGMTALNASEGLGDREFEVFFECSGNATATLDGITALARNGHAVLIGMGGDELPLPLSRVQDRELVVTGSFRYANTWPTAVALAASGAVNLDAVVTGHFTLDEVETALTASRNDAAAIKVMVCP